MLRKILFTLFFILSSVIYSQDTSSGYNNNNDVDNINKTIIDVKASINPMVSHTNIIFESTKKQNIIIKLYSLTKGIVLNRYIKAKIGQNSFLLSRENLKAGMYIYSIQNEKELISKRLVIR